MSLQYNIHLFRRDLRLHDNTALNAAAEEGLPVLPVFILDPRQTGDHPYRSVRAGSVLAGSLRDLNRQLEQLQSGLLLLDGLPEDVLEELFQYHPPVSVFANRDYTPFSRRRDRKLVEICKKNGIPLKLFDDVCLHPPGSVLKSDGGPYRVFTPYFRQAAVLEQRPPVTRKIDFLSGKASRLSTGFRVDLLDDYFPQLHDTAWNGGRGEALSLLDHACSLTDYELLRDIPAEKGTSRLSAPLKFGCLSVREVHHSLSSALGPSCELIRQLHWRDFFVQIAFHFPEVFGSPFRKKYAELPWILTGGNRERWEKGSTGFPFIDAGIRELKQTGYMHNRVRMVAASFFVKDLHGDWLEGESFFARYLADYDPALNNGNWQWAASTGCDAQPYFRIFNPWSQQRKFDPDALYIKQWLPELESFSAQEIHRLETGGGLAEYPAPCVDHKAESRWTLEQYRRI